MRPSFTYPVPLSVIVISLVSTFPDATAVRLGGSTESAIFSDL